MNKLWRWFLNRLIYAEPLWPGMKRFCVTVDGQVVDAAKVVGSSHYSSGNERIILVPEFVYEKWGREFSEAVVGLLSRKRKFSYKSYSNDFMYNLSRKNLEAV